jgi:hypothetical protein
MPVLPEKVVGKSRGYALSVFELISLCSVILSLFPFLFSCPISLHKVYLMPFSESDFGFLDSFVPQGFI